MQVKRLLKKPWDFIIQDAYAAEHQWIILGLIGVISFVLYYFIWNEVIPNEYNNIPLRLVGFFLCVFLVLKNYWPKSLQPILPIYWFITLLYCFPFFFCFMLFNNPNSYVWLITTMTGLFFLLLLVNWLILVTLVIIGLGAAWGAYILTTPEIITPTNFINTLPSYLTVLIAGGIFIYRNDQIQEEKLNGLIALSSIVAHEMRTPLRTIDSSIDGVSRILPPLIEGYGIARDKDLEVPFVAPQQIRVLGELTQNIKSETHAAFTFIDMLLLKTKHTSEGEQQDYAMQECVDLAIQRYPFSKEDRNNIPINISGDDFIFHGNKDFMLHVFFNLLKNALYYIHKAQKGHISIRLVLGEKFNTVYFKDTGTGITPHDLSHIFERFFSRTQHGTGLGLAFSKMVMESMGGTISCQSTLGEFTEFTMRFPIIDNNKRG